MAFKNKDNLCSKRINAILDQQYMEPPTQAEKKK